MRGRVGVEARMGWDEYGWVCTEVIFGHDPTPLDRNHHPAQKILFSSHLSTIEELRGLQYTVGKLRARASKWCIGGLSTDRWSKVVARSNVGFAFRGVRWGDNKK